VKVWELHSWNVNPNEAVSIQKNLAAMVSSCDESYMPHFIAGADISIDRLRTKATAAVVVLRYPELELVNSIVIDDKIGFPYIPGLLSFREAPLILQAFQKLEKDFDLLLVDGQGVAHPRRMGLASHLGLILDKPTIGCAKSRLIGTYREPPNDVGRWTGLVDEGDLIGAVLRTRKGAKPIYVSIGNKISLPSAIDWTLACCHGYRIPEPLRLAHIMAGNQRLKS
jgi:deoxyribonuclease V